MNKWILSTKNKYNKCVIIPIVLLILFTFFTNVSYNMYKNICAKIVIQDAQSFTSFTLRSNSNNSYSMDDNLENNESIYDSIVNGLPQNISLKEYSNLLKSMSTLTAVLSATAFVWLIIRALKYSSYIEIYDNHITGKMFNNLIMKKTMIRNDEIINVLQRGNAVYFKTNSGTYTIYTNTKLADTIYRLYNENVA